MVIAQFQGYDSLVSVIKSIGCFIISHDPISSSYSTFQWQNMTNHWNSSKETMGGEGRKLGGDRLMLYKCDCRAPGSRGKAWHVQRDNTGRGVTVQFPKVKTIKCCVCSATSLHFIWTK